jgi:hypothetical protein
MHILKGLIWAKSNKVFSLKGTNCQNLMGYMFSQLNSTTDQVAAKGRRQKWLHVTYDFGQLHSAQIMHFQFH